MKDLSIMMRWTKATKLMMINEVLAWFCIIISLFISTDKVSSFWIYFLTLILFSLLFDILSLSFFLGYILLVLLSHLERPRAKNILYYCLIDSLDFKKLLCKRFNQVLFGLYDLSGPFGAIFHNLYYLFVN